MTKNLVAKNGTVIHAPAVTDRNPVLCSNMRRASGYEIVEAGFSQVDAPVTCTHCCRILGIPAPEKLPTAAEVKAMRAYRPEPTQAEREAAIEAQRAAELDNTAARLAVDAGVQTWNGESYAAWLTKGTVEYRELMDTFHVEAAREYAWSLKLAAKMARRHAFLAKKA
jgi:hypothetical protein